MQDVGIAVNGTPAVGSVAWYAGSPGDDDGHVAFVEQVLSSTSVVISEMNYDFDNGFRVRTITTSSGWPTDFIHITRTHLGRRGGPLAPRTNAISVSLGRDGTVWYTQPGCSGAARSTGSAASTPTGSPSIALTPDGNVVIAALGANENNIWYTIPGVQGWTSTGSYFVGGSDPAVTVAENGTITIVVRGTDNTIWYDEPGVQAWTSTGSGF